MLRQKLVEVAKDEHIFKRNQALSPMKPQPSMKRHPGGKSFGRKSFRFGGAAAAGALSPWDIGDDGDLAPAGIKEHLKWALSAHLGEGMQSIKVRQLLLADHGVQELQQSNRAFIIKNIVSRGSKFYSVFSWITIMCVNHDSGAGDQADPSLVQVLGWIWFNDGSRGGSRGQ